MVGHPKYYGKLNQIQDWTVSVYFKDSKRVKVESKILTWCWKDFRWLLARDRRTTQTRLRGTRTPSTWHGSMRREKLNKSLPSHWLRYPRTSGSPSQ